MDREALVHFIGGAIGGTVGTAITCPFEVIKTRLQSSSCPQTKIQFSKFLGQIIKNEGPSALYKGLVPNLIAVAPSKAIYFYTYSTCKRFCNSSSFFVPNSAFTHMLSAGVGGAVTTTIINPVWVIKTRLQLHQGSLSVAACARRIFQNDGYRGFFKGVTASYMGISETIIQFVLYERFRVIVDEMNRNNAHNGRSEAAHFSNFMVAGGAAKFIASVAAYPCEVVRTRLREEKSTATGFFSTLHQLYQQGGYRLLYRGISVQLCRSVPNTAITMTTYEVVVYFGHQSI